MNLKFAFNFLFFISSAENMSVLVEILAASRGVSDESISTQELKIVDYG